MRTALCWALLCIVAGSAYSEETTLPLRHAQINSDDRTTLQRGAEIFADRCFSCHSLGNARYSRLATDLGWREADIRKRFRLRKGQKINQPITSAMNQSEAAQWFRIAPPDLSLTARSRGADWVFTYITSFYLDEKRPNGINNLLYKAVVMPHVLIDWQGTQTPEFKTRGHRQVFTGFRVVEPGSISTAEFEARMNDLVSFLSYMAEPAKMQRYRTGKYVLFFLLGFAVIAYKLKKAYWRDVH